MATKWSWAGGIVLVLALVFLPGQAGAISADDLLNLLMEEKVITPEKAERLKQKARKLEQAREAEERAKRAQELERVKQEAKAEAKAEAAKEAKVAVEKAGSKPKLDYGYKGGFYLKTLDGKYSMRLRLGFQPRFTYLQRDHDVIANAENNAYFKFRRLRLLFNGNAFDKDLKYYVQVKLEPHEKVTVHDAYIWFSRYKFFQPWVGRSKLPFGQEIRNSWQTSNFVDRSIFCGDSDKDWPGPGDQRMPTSTTAYTGGNERFNVGGLNLFRSQGVMVMGDIDLWAPRNFRYWAGIFNGVNTQGIDEMHDDALCYVGSLMFSPLPRGGPTDAEFTTWGDYNYTKGWPLFWVLYSMYHNTDQNRTKRPGTDVAESYDTMSYGFDLAAGFKWYGFSLYWEAMRETFREKRPDTFIPGQLGQGDRTFHREGWYIAAGQFLIPKRLELVARYAYVNRLKDRNPYNSAIVPGAATIVPFAAKDNGGINNNAIEGILREYTVGLTYYVNGHNHKYAVDYSRLIRQIYGANDQHDNRFRFMGHWIF